MGMTEAQLACDPQFGYTDPGLTSIFAISFFLFFLFQVSFIQASSDGLITGPVKGQVHQISAEHRHTGEALVDNPTTTLAIFQYPNAALLWLRHVK